MAEEFDPRRQSAPRQTVQQAMDSEAMRMPVASAYAVDNPMQSGTVGTRQIQEATKILNEYKQGKGNLEQRVIDNEEWYKLRHWESMRRNNQSRKKKSNQVEPVSGWLFNAIQNKRADAMDNYPTCTIQPRENSDRAEAKKLSSIVPVVLDNCDFEEVYDDVQDQKFRSGTGIYGVFWDTGKLGGLGDISIKKVDVLNLFWQSGITDIQQSRNLFYVDLIDNDLLEEMYPQLKGKLGGQNTTISTYIYDDTVRTDDKSAVIDWYYKRWQKNKMVLHYCKYCNDTVLFATENEAEYKDRGWYDHGLYPFVFDPLFRTAGTPCGFGYIDVAKSEQEYIDRGNQAIMENLLVNARPRHFIRTDGGVNEKEYADMTNDFIHVEGSLGEDSIRPVYSNRPLAGTYVNVINNKVEELKEVTGNRDVSTGGTASGVTSASAIAALQEAGSKLARLGNKASHRAYRRVCLMVIELIRQFYDLPRQFRIVGEMGMQEFVSYSNAGIAPQPQGDEMGVDMGIRLPLFDVEVNTEKASPYSRISANEMALQFYQAGFFNPQLADQALSCLEMMDFDQKDKIMQIIRMNGQAFQMAQMQMAQMGAQPTGEPMPEGNSRAVGMKENSGKEHPFVAKARARVANATSPD